MKLAALPATLPSVSELTRTVKVCEEVEAMVRVPVELSLSQPGSTP